VAEEALTQYLDGIADTSLLLRRIDRLGRGAARAQRDIELLSEAFAVFTKLWFAHTPPVPDDMKVLALEYVVASRLELDDVLAHGSGGGSGSRWS
jgi:hypothetical protein